MTETNPLETTVTHRSKDTLARLKTHPEINATGKDYFSAIGNLVASHQSVFLVKIDIPDVEKKKEKPTSKKSTFFTPTHLPSSLPKR